MTTNPIIEAAAEIALDHSRQCLKSARQYEYASSNAKRFRARANEADLIAQDIAAMPVPSPWRDIESAPKDRVIEVYAPRFEDALPALVCLAFWHKDAGFTVCTLRTATHWREHVAPESPPS